MVQIEAIMIVDGTKLRQGERKKHFLVLCVGFGVLFFDAVSC